MCVSALSPREHEIVLDNEAGLLAHLRRLAWAFPPVPVSGSDRYGGKRQRGEIQQRVLPRIHTWFPFQLPQERALAAATTLSRRKITAFSRNTQSFEYLSAFFLRFRLQ